MKKIIGSFDVEGKKYDLIEIEKPESAYIILEILSKDKNLSRGVHIIKMEAKTSIQLVLINGNKIIKWLNLLGKRSW